MDERENEEKMKKQKAFIRMLGLSSTLDVLHFLYEKNEGNYAQFQQFANTPTLNTRLRELIEYSLIEHHFEKKKTRREWYTITEEGRKAVELCRELGRIVG